MVMPNVDTFDQEEDVLGDVSSVIRHAFQIMRDENQIERGRGGRLPLFHQVEQLAVNGILEIVDFIVGGKHKPRQMLIALHEGVETFLTMDSTVLDIWEISTSSVN